MLTTASVGVSGWPTTNFPKPVFKSSMKLSLAFLSLLCAGLLAAPVPQAAAAAAFDGRWSVTIVPTSGECSARRTVPIQVSNGRITYDGSFRAQAKGKVSPKGAIDVTFARKGDVA